MQRPEPGQAMRAGALFRVRTQVCSVAALRSGARTTGDTTAVEKPLDHLLAADAGSWRAAGRRQRPAFARSSLVRSPRGSARMLYRFGDIDQMQEVAERADDVQRIVDGKAVERLFQPRAGNRHLRVVLVPRFAAPQSRRRRRMSPIFSTPPGQSFPASPPPAAVEQAAVSAQALLFVAVRFLARGRVCPLVVGSAQEQA